MPLASGSMAGCSMVLRDVDQVDAVDVRPVILGQMPVKRKSGGSPSQAENAFDMTMLSGLVVDHNSLVAVLIPFQAHGSTSGTSFFASRAGPDHCYDPA